LSEEVTGFHDITMMSSDICFNSTSAAIEMNKKINVNSCGIDVKYERVNTNLWELEVERVQ
jgi:hypothetical protein